jgi:hypothetical protein
MRLRPLTCVLLLAIVLAAACASSSTGDEPLVTTLCASAQAARDGDVAEAEERFASVHDPLHTLARELQDADRRSVAGDVLEAKHQVEAAFGSDVAADEVAERVTRLSQAVATATSASLPADCAPTE